jgi:hypothetical protein
MSMTMPPNNSPEPTPIAPADLPGSRGLAGVVGSARLSFFR